MRYDFCVIGGGIVGLATARELLRRRPGSSVVLLEKEVEVSSHQTGHNSGVIHAGVYYAPGSMKARLCRAGNERTKSFCAEHAIPVDVCGKLIVATDAVEVQRLCDLRGRCRANHIAFEDVSGTDLQTDEPNIMGAAALLIPSTGIVDYRQVSRALAHDIGEASGEIHIGTSVERIVENREEAHVITKDTCVRARQVIACAGLQSDRLARASGLDIELRIVPFRGEYFRLPSQKSDIVKHLIYPVPDPELPFLGVHLTRMIGGFVTVGPNAVLGLAREGYEHFSFDLQDTLATLFFPGFWRVVGKHWRSAIDELRGSLQTTRYLERCRKYCPDLCLDDLQPYPAGIRAQAVMRDGTLVHDFVFANTARTLHVLNAPSPAATAALPIAEMIVARTLGETFVS